MTRLDAPVNLGLNDEVAEGMVARTGDLRQLQQDVSVARADVAEDEVLDAALDALQALSDLARDRHDEVGLARDHLVDGRGPPEGLPLFG